MSDINLSAVLFKKDDLRLVERPVPQPGHGEVQIAIQSVGVCGSDVKYWTDGHSGIPLTGPMILGHECSGVVSKLGEGVKELNIGDRVAVEPHVVCWKCEFCKEGRYNLCKNLLFLAAAPYDGSLARYLVHGADFVFKLPENVSFEEGALMEPLSVGLHVCRRARMTMGDKVLICGAGPIGLCTLLSAKAFGASAVCITEFQEIPVTVHTAKTDYTTVLFKKDDLRLVERPVPQPGHGEVQIAIQSVGVCGSDVKYWTDGHSGIPLTGPMILGHECSGVVSKLGEGVKELNIGDRVAVEPHVVCWKCEFCKEGRYNLCKNLLFLAAAPYDGSLARYLVHGADFVFKLPENVSFEEGALMEPLSVGLHVCRRARMTMGDKVLICGGGPIGLCTLLSAKAFGASAVCITDVNAHRLEFAKKIGAKHTIQIELDDTPEAVASKVKEVLGGAPERSIECSGAQFSVDLGVYATRPGGVFAIVGFGRSEKFPVVHLVCNEIEIVGSCRYLNTYQSALEMVSCGKIDVNSLVTHRFQLEQTLEAFQTAKSGVGVKVIIDCSRPSRV